MAFTAFIKGQKSSLVLNVLIDKRPVSPGPFLFAASIPAVEAAFIVNKPQIRAVFVDMVAHVRFAGSRMPFFTFEPLAQHHKMKAHV